MVYPIQAQMTTVYEIQLIEIKWSGPFTYDELLKFESADHGPGLYMVYGNHPVYGNDVLLYIGRTEVNIKNRISNHEMLEYPELECKAYFGYVTPSKENLDIDLAEQIRIAEALLIERHYPAFNKQLDHNNHNLKSRPICVLNWDSRRSLQADVTNLNRFSAKMKKD